MAVVVTPLTPNPMGGASDSVARGIIYEDAKKCMDLEQYLDLILDVGIIPQQLRRISPAQARPLLARRLRMQRAECI